MIPILELIRLETSKVYGTLGILKINKKVFCCTLEESDCENELNISSIPTGQYVCRRYSSAKYRNTFEVISVTGRSGILFHAGNTEEDTQGCILVGDRFDKLSSHERAVLNSGNTFDRFMNKLDDYIEFHLTITENY